MQPLKDILLAELAATVLNDVLNIYKYYQIQ